MLKYSYRNLLIILFITTFSNLIISQTRYLIGDVNNDNNIDILDIVRMVDIIIGQGMEPTSYELWAGNFNFDEVIDILDIAIVINNILDADTLFNWNMTNWEYLGFEGEGVVSILQDPYEDGVYYVGTTSAWGGEFQGGIYKTQNGGADWDTLMTSVSVSQMTLNSYDSQILTATLNDVNLSNPGLVISDNGGQYWIDISDGIPLGFGVNVYPVAIKPDSPTTILTGTTGLAGGYIYRTINGGADWELAPGTESWGSLYLLYDPENPQICYASLSSVGILKSSDAGAIWDLTIYETPATSNWIKLDPRDSDVIYISDYSLGGIQMSYNSGDVWGAFSELPDSLDIFYNPNLQFEIYQIDQSKVVYFLGSPYGIYSSENGLSWHLINQGLPSDEYASYPELEEATPIKVLSINTYTQTILITVTHKGLFRLDLSTIVNYPMRK